MAEVHEHTTETDDVEFTLDRETLGTILVRHPWAVRFVIAEIAVLSLAGIIPLFGEAPMKYVLFGMLVSIAGLGMVAASLIGLVMVTRWGVRELRHASAH